MAGSKKIASVYAELSVQDKMTHGLKSAGKKLRAFERQTMKRMGGAAMTGVGVAVGAAVVGLAVGTKKALSMADDLADMSAQTGIAISSLMKLGQAYKDNGKDAASVGKDINKMQKALATGAADEALKELGLSAKDLMALSPDEQFFKIGEAINAIQNPARKAALAMQIFGKSGGQLLAVFAGSDLDDINKTLGSMPKLVEEFAAEMGRANDLLDRMGNKSDQFFVGFTTGILDDLLPALEKLDKMDLVSWGQETAEQFMMVTKQVMLLADMLSLPIQGFYLMGERLSTALDLDVPEVLGGMPDVKDSPADFQMGADGQLEYIDPASRKPRTAFPKLENLPSDQPLTKEEIKRAEALAEYTHELALLQAKQAGDNPTIKALEKEWDIRKKIKELTEDGFDPAEAESMAKAWADAREAAEAPPARDWEETSLEVNDYQKRGLALAGSMTGKKEDKQVPLLTHIRDILKAATKDGRQLWNL